jgi:hypothetical protein
MTKRTEGATDTILKKRKVCCAWLDTPNKSDDGLWRARLWTNYYDKTGNEEPEFVREFKHKLFPTLCDRAKCWAANNWWSIDWP